LVAGEALGVEGALLDHPTLILCLKILVYLLHDCLGDLPTILDDG